MNASAWVSQIAGSPAWAALCVATALLACIGLGRTLLTLCAAEFRHAGLRALTALALGLDLFAFLAAALALLKIQGLPAKAAICAALPFACVGTWLLLQDLRRGAKHLFRGKALAPAALIGFPLLVYAGAALCPPIGWDELVYQIAVPERWLASGLAQVSPDLPYSGFPALPQFLYWPLLESCGAIGPKLLSFALLGASALALSALCRLRSTRLAGALIACAFLLSPVASFLAKEAYAEQFILFNFLAALLTLKSLRRDGVKTWRSSAFAGVFAGACAAVKLTGSFAGAALLPFLLLAAGPLKKKLASAAILCVVAGVFLTPFQLRPLLETGNPLFPYFASHFGSASAAELDSSEFHHQTGSARFGADGLPGLLANPLLLGIPFAPFNELCDGSYGLQLLFLGLLALAFLWFRKREGEGLRRSDLAALVALAALYLLWFASAKQARFLLPGFALLCVLGAAALNEFPNKAKALLAALLALALASFPPKALSHLSISWQALADPNGQANYVYNGTGSDYLPGVDALLRLTPPDAKVLLLFEERTLYIPRRCEIGTPFFQAKRFTPPDATTPDDLLAQLREGSFTHVYARAPEDCPDLLKSHLERCAKLFEALRELERRGDLKTLWRGDSSAVLWSVAAQK